MDSRGSVDGAGALGGARRAAVRGAGPPRGKASEVFSKYLITDMYAKAVQGMPAEDAVRWTEVELRRIYEA